MIDILKHFSETEKTRKESNTKSKDVNKSKRNDIITIKEFWSILSSDDKDIFSNDLIVFEKWVKKLDPKVKEYYIERLVEGKTLIPPFEGFDADISDYKWPEYNENDKYNLDETYDSEEEIDYENKVVISFIDNFTCISNYDIAKINRIKFQLLSFGILETEIRTKKIEDKILYTLVYDGQQNINKIDWD